MTWAYALLLVVTLLLHGKYVSLDTGWIYWLLTTLIVLSVSFFVSAALSALKPALFSKAKRRDPVASALLGASQSTQPNLGAKPTPSLPHANVPVADLINQREHRVEVTEPRSVVEGTTKNLDDRINQP